MEIKKVVLREGGMFSNVNEVIQRLHLAKQGGFQFFVDWSKSVYVEPQMSGDPWEYFFEPCFPTDGTALQDLELWNNADKIITARDNIITPRASWRDGGMLLPPTKRHLAHRYIENHLRLKPHIQKIIDDFAAEQFNTYTIGLHIRGKGRDHGGAAELRAQLSLEDGVPYTQYFKLVGETLSAYPGARIFICSDSRLVINRVHEEFGDRVFWYESARSDFGEMHERHKSTENAQFSGYRLGEDILVESYLLARTDILMHGNSNVSNFVLCKNPDMPHIYAYEGIRPFTLTQALSKFLEPRVQRAQRILARLVGAES